jgi:hypothetical protein
MNISVINGIWSIFTGENLDLEDPSLSKVVQVIVDFLRVLSPSGTTPLAVVLPRQMLSWPFIDKLSGYKTTKDAIVAVGNLVSIA